MPDARPRHLTAGAFNVLDVGGCTNTCFWEGTYMQNRRCEDIVNAEGVPYCICCACKITTSNSCAWCVLEDQKCKSLNPY